MTYTFPLSLANLADLLPLERADWNELRQETASGLGTGEFLTHNLGPVLWEADCQTIEVYNEAAEQLMARLRALDGSSQAFYLYNPVMPYPQADPDGSILGASSVAISTIHSNRKQWSLSGLPAGYVLTIGDYAEVTYSTSRRALVQFVEGGPANGSGVSPELEIRPHLRPGITTTLAVNLIKPAAKVKLLPGTLRVERGQDSLFSRLRFMARQTLAA